MNSEDFEKRQIRDGIISGLILSFISGVVAFGLALVIYQDFLL